MITKYEDDYHNCTTERLAELLNEYAKEADETTETAKRNGLIPEAAEHFEGKAALLREAANRLISLSQHHYEHFNSEQFNI